MLMLRKIGLGFFGMMVGLIIGMIIGSLAYLMICVIGWAMTGTILNSVEALRGFVAAGGIICAIIGFIVGFQEGD